MRFAFLSLWFMMTSFGSAVLAEGKPMIVVELFTSQGCSSCPPADDILTQLAQEDDIIALSLHVNYWDYLGWKDKFAMEKFSDRQLTYNAILPSRYRLVTPQTIIHAKAQVAGGTGASPMLIREYVEKARREQPRIDLQIARSGGTVEINVAPKADGLKKANVILVHFVPSQGVKIKAGENRGRDISYTNVVSHWETIAQWNGQAPAQMAHPLPQDNPFAIIVQEHKQGPIYAAAKVK